MTERPNIDRSIEGAGVALLTIFDSDGKLELSQTCALASHLVDAGVRSVLVGGTVGEYYTLTDLERIELFSAVRSVVPIGVPLILHVGGVPLVRARELARAAVAAGADALIALPRGVEDLEEYYGELVAAANSIPMLAYHFPLVGASIGVESLERLGVAGVKDSSGDENRLILEVESLDIDVYTGATSLINVAHHIGARGAFLGMANVRPELCLQAFEGDVDAQQLLNEVSAGIVDEFPGGLKKMTADRWNLSASSRTPPGLRIAKASSSFDL